jgi:UDP-N-acetylglucosamine transferase subunit ALG13
MIFVTVGTQLAFDRMVRAVDSWAENHREAEVFAQIGPAQYVPKNVAYERFVEPSVFSAKAQACEAMVAQAGIGSIFTALELRKPIILMPRRAELAEHRNDHQLATVAKFRDLSGIYVAETQNELHALLDGVEGLVAPRNGFALQAQSQLLDAVRAFVNEDEKRLPRTQIIRSHLRLLLQGRRPDA